MALAAVLLLAQASAPSWGDVQRRAETSVVSVRSRVRVALGRDEVGSLEGSGFVVDLDRRLVATNRHVAGEGVVLDLEVRFDNGETSPARRVWADPLHDFAFLEFDPLPPEAAVTELPLREKSVGLGEDVLMVGNNGGLAATVLSGRISNLAAVWEQDPGVAYLQTSIASAAGSSGSPILDRRGAVVGMQSAHDVNHSYALPADYLAGALANLRQRRPPPRGTLGLRMRPAQLFEMVSAGVASARVEAGERPAPLAAVADGVVPDSPAWEKIRPGDLVLAIDGREAADGREIERVLDAAVDREVGVSIVRDGVASTVRLTVADLNRDVPQTLVLSSGACFHDVGYELRARADLRRRGAFVSCVAPGSAAEAAGLERDDLVVAVGGKPVEDAASIARILAAARDGERLTLVVRRPSSFDSATRTLALVIDRVWDPSRILVRRRSPDGTAAAQVWEEEAPPASRPR